MCVKDSILRKDSITMYCVQFCYELTHKVIAIFNDKGLAIEYALFKKRTVKETIFIDKPCAIEVLDGDKQILRLPLSFDM